jgi:hypothetical protein
MKVIFAFDAAIVRTSRQHKRLLPCDWVMSFYSHILPECDTIRAICFGQLKTLARPVLSTTSRSHRQKHEEDGAAHCTIFQHLKNDSCMSGWIVA